MKYGKSKMKLAAFLFAVVLTIPGCGKSDQTLSKTGNEEEQTTQQGKTQEAEQAEDDAGSLENSALVDELKKKYAGGDTQYDGNVISVKREQPIEIKIGYNPWDGEISPYESFAVYQDAELKFPVKVGVMDYDPETGTLTIEPPFSGTAEIMESDTVDLSHLKGSYLSGDEESGWGTLSQYYMRTSVDLETGKALEAPVITVIKVVSEIEQAPQLVFDQMEDGFARFSWKAVPGADGYLLFKINKDEEGLWDYSYAFADVKGTEWTSKGDGVNEFQDKILSLNYRFRQYYFSSDDQEWFDKYGDFLEQEQDDVAYDEYWDEYYGLIAYNDNGCSPISNLLSAKDVSHMLPTEMARYHNEESFFDINGIQALPAIMNVTMCDGSMTQKILDYDFDSIEKDEENNTVRIMAKAFQTPFTEELTVREVNWETLDADLEAVKKRQEELINKGGNIAPSLTIDDGAASEGEAAQPEEETQQGAEGENSQFPSNEGKEIKITANSAMSEYIALNMLETKKEIRLSDFPEAADMEQIVDAFFEAQYQNPLILGVQGGSIDSENRTLFVEYDFDRKTTAAKQQEVQERVLQITGEIISEDMTDAEKEMAINTWLCDNAVYDDAALENAEKYSFTQVDEDFYDSFTAYGILNEGVGVCASYSAAFKLLADAAGLESIVVTGYLEGSVPHAWNKVRLEDNWYIVDATNNDNEIIRNALMNLSDTAAYSTLVENDKFVMNGSVGNYMAREDDQEYYRVNDRYFEIDEISEELAKLLLSDGKAVLRTDYNIDDAAFYEIAQQAAEKAEKNINGFYWMGVIRLEE